MDGDKEKQVREQRTLTPNEFLQKKNASMKETFLICAADESESWICNTDEGGWSDSDPRSSCFGKVFMVWPEICEKDGLKNLYPNLWNT